MLASLATVLLSLTALASAQDISRANNVTSLYGTWSSGVGNVMTGMGFANPVNYSFTYPKTSGISYSFTDDGHFEEAQYRFTSNASLPNCITAVVLWQHGSYNLGANGSLVLHPIAADGRIQVQDPCAAVTNIITVYNQLTLYADWGIQIDAIKSNYALNLNRFDGAPMPPLYLVARPPNMLPTNQLSGAGQTVTTTINGVVTTQAIKKRAFPLPAEPTVGGGSVLRKAAVGVAGVMAVAGVALVLARERKTPGGRGERRRLA